VRGRAKKERPGEKKKWTGERTSSPPHPVLLLKYAKDREEDPGGTSWRLGLAKRLLNLGSRRWGKKDGKATLFKTREEEV